MHALKYLATDRTVGMFLVNMGTEGATYYGGKQYG